MSKSLLCVLASMFLALGAAAQAPVFRTGGPSIESPVQPVVCVGHRRNYSSFGHCWRVNGRLNPRNASYCHRICPARGK